MYLRDESQQVPEKFLKPFYKVSVAQLNGAWMVKYTNLMSSKHPFAEQRDGVWRQQFGKTEVELGMVWLQVLISCFWMLRGHFLRFFVVL